LKVREREMKMKKEYISLLEDTSQYSSSRAANEAFTSPEGEALEQFFSVSTPHH
jgi:hypothetical protein